MSVINLLAYAFIFVFLVDILIQSILITSFVLIRERCLRVSFKAKQNRIIINKLPFG